jgi:NAD(P)-dependent dehydrogenase (short-subunit alcohol dehydrogenase family)
MPQTTPETGTSANTASQKLAVVTGGARGIGLAIGQRLLAEGYSVIAAGRSGPEVKLPPGLAYAQLDVTDKASVHRFFSGLGRLDLLVNNAGLAGKLLPEDDNPALWDDILATNLTGAWDCSRAALAKLPDRTGRIVNIASILALRGEVDQPAYCAAKHGLIGLTRSMALYLGPRGITVNAICPGWVLTDMAAQRFEELNTNAGEIARNIPIQRMAGMDEVAAMVVYLAGPASGAVTGQALVIDGGTSLRA